MKTYNTNSSKELKMKQLQFETNSWKRLLIFMMDENIHLKNRLSDLLTGKPRQNLLVKAEKFNNDFVRQDALIAVLRNDIAEFEKFVVKQMNAENEVTTIAAKLSGIRNNLDIAEKQFKTLQLNFNNYLLEYS